MPIAILYQAIPPPVYDGIVKPIKASGYSDSGADIGAALKRMEVPLITPVKDADPRIDGDWVFPDSKEGIDAALKMGADTFWLNTVLFGSHPIVRFSGQGLKMIGQRPESVDIYDDKIRTSAIFRERVNIPNQVVIDLHGPLTEGLAYPKVVKPIRGRGSQGVFVVNDEKELLSALNYLKTRGSFGEKVYLEDFLPGREITISVLPPGKYRINGGVVTYNRHWCLPVVERFNHKNGIAPYSGTVAVSQNSRTMSAEEMKSSFITEAIDSCSLIASEINAEAPMRIDGRADGHGRFFLFDYNLKPNMTGPGRPGRDGQDSLTAIAAQSIGWSYDDLVLNLSKQIHEF